MMDLAIIGGGISGCSLLYQLSRYRVKTVLLEKENDIGVATTKANSAIVHAGYDPEPGTLMARYNVEGNRIVEQLCKDLDIMYKKTGSLVLAFSEEDRQTLQELLLRGNANGVPDLRIIEKKELKIMEPNLADTVVCALFAPSAGIVNPWELASAQAEVAVEGGAEVKLNCTVTGIRREKDGFVVSTTQGEVKARFVVNAAGVAADKISALIETPDYQILPNRGQYYLLDKSQGDLIEHIVFQCPSKNGKGILVAPTVHGNLIVGPDSHPCTPNDASTSADGLAYVRNTAALSVPNINFRESIRNFAGVRATSTNPDFIVRESSQTSGFFEIAGIKSPGLTAAPAIAKSMLQMLLKAGLILEENPNFVAKRSILRFKHLDGNQRDAAIKKNPLYGTIVCRCETITEGEIVDALHRPLAPKSIDAIKRRCNPGMGRCQGGFCGPRVQAIISRELDIPMQNIPLDREGMNIIIGRTKEEGN